MTTRAQHFGLEERWLKRTRPFCGNSSTTIPPVQAASCFMRSQKHRCRFLSLSVKSIGCGKHGVSIEGKGAHAEQALKKNSESQGKLVSVTPCLSCVGVHVFAHGLDQQHAFDPVVAQLTQAVHA